MFVKEITKRYDGKAVVDGVSFEVPKGKVLSLIGPNGAGKSTVMGMLSRLIARDSGLVDFEGTEITRWKSQELSKRLAILTQANNVQMKLTVRELVAFGRFPYSGGRLTQEDNEIIDRAIAYMELGDFEEQFIDELSGGQRQRVAIARAIAISPELLICDEATGALDVSVQNQIAQLLVDLIEEQNMGCIFIGHDLALVRSVTQRIAVMYLGRIVEKKMTELGNSLMHGDISIKPYEYEGRKPCEYCEFKNICAYEDGVDQVEKIKKVSLEEGKHALDQTTAESH